MQRTATSLILLAATILAGCPAAPRYLSQPRSIHQPGIYVHEGSGTIFPPTVGPFSRSAVHEYDEEGLDASASYIENLPGGPIVVSVYVRPSPPILSIGSPENVVEAARGRLTDQVWEEEKAQIAQSHEKVQMVGEGTFNLTRSGDRVTGRRAVFHYAGSFAGREQTLRSSLILFSYVAGKWDIKYRISHPEALDATKEIDAFVQAWDWTARR